MIARLGLILTIFATVHASELSQDDQQLNLKMVPFFNLNNNNENYDLRTIESGMMSMEELTKNIHEINLNRVIVETIVQSQADCFNSLERSLQNATEDPASVVAAVNSAFRVNLFVINGDMVEINPNALEKVILTQTKSLIRTLYPGNLMKQIMMYATAQIQISSVFRNNINPLLEAQSVSLSYFSNANSVISQSRSKRSIISDMVSSVISAQVSAVLTPIQSQVNSTLYGVTTTILSLASEVESSNALLSVLTNLANTLLVSVANIVENLRALVNELFDSLATSLTTLRKRRTVGEIVEFSDFTGVEVRSKRSITSVLSNVISYLWKLIATVLNLSAKSLLGSSLTYLTSYLTTFITDTVGGLATTLINTLFPCSSC